MGILLRKIKKASRLIAKGELRGFGEAINENIRNVKSGLKSRLYAAMTGKLALNTLEINVTDRCTLRCKGCANLMQFFTKPSDYDFKTFRSDFVKTMTMVSYVKQIRIIGGEPLLYRHLGPLLLFLRQYRRKYSSVLLITNGTLLPSEKLLARFKQTKVLVQISNYGKLSVRMDELKTALKAYKIPFSSSSLPWTANSQLIDGDEVTEAQAAAKYRACTAGCNHIRDGRFYHCPFLQGADILRAIPHDPRDYIDLLDSKVTKETLKQYKSKDNVPPGCRWCSGFYLEAAEIPVAEQLKAPGEYKRYE
jgi:MoaA/NifB/PqqE/SkfB family radical SAM enzyme